MLLYYFSLHAHLRNCRFSCYFFIRFCFLWGRNACTAEQDVFSRQEDWGIMTGAFDTWCSSVSYDVWSDTCGRGWCVRACPDVLWYILFVGLGGGLVLLGQSTRKSANLKKRKKIYESVTLWMYVPKPVSAQTWRRGPLSVKHGNG